MKLDDLSKFYETEYKEIIHTLFEKLHILMPMEPIFEKDLEEPPAEPDTLFSLCLRIVISRFPGDYKNDVYKNLPDEILVQIITTIGERGLLTPAIISTYAVDEAEADSWRTTWSEIIVDVSKDRKRLNNHRITRDRPDRWKQY